MPDNKIIVNGTVIKLLQGDITLQETDAIVNAANSGLMGGGGVDGAIHRAGGPVIMEECRKIIAEIGRLPAGQAVITSGGHMRTRHVIHTVGPVWHGGSKSEPEVLASAYRESLKLATEKGLQSVSFPSISTGVYGYPAEKASVTALETVSSFLESEVTSIKQVVFVLFDPRTFNSYAAALSLLKG